jgi:DNA protecting protein DprA
MNFRVEAFPFLQKTVNPLPPQLWIRCSSPDTWLSLTSRLPNWGFAVVGTRYPTRRSLQEVRRILSALDPAQGFVVVSGLAKGIDAEAHRCALDLGLPTLAVLAGGLDEIYPTENERLAHEILDRGGAWVSEYDPGFRPRKGTFLARNRLIAGLSQATWIVEAGLQSGALNTAKWSRDFGTDLYVSPFHPSDTPGAGNRELLSQNACWPLWGPDGLQSTWLNLHFKGTARKTDDNSEWPPEACALWRHLNQSRTGEGPGVISVFELTSTWRGGAEALSSALHTLRDSGKLRVSAGWIELLA